MAKAITESTSNRNTYVGVLDLLDRTSITAFAAQWTGPLDVLINNAGVMAIPDLRRTREGCGMHFATNHLGHFALTLVLHGALAAVGNVRVVKLVSATHHHAPVDFDDINFERRAYDPCLAYAQSKTANILMAVETAKHWADDGISVNSVHPGEVLETGLMRHVEVIPDL
ncbi:MAG: SDR family oxidoreductase [Novosphingobium sp.]